MIRMLGKSKPKKPPPDISQTIQTIDGRADSVDKKIVKLETELKKYIDQLARMREGPAKDTVKQKAIRVLNQKRMYESQVESLRNQSFNMEQTNFATQSVKDTRETVTAMKKGVVSMKKELRKINIDRIDDLQEEMAGLIGFHEEVQEAVGRTYGVPNMDEDELQAELEALGEELALDNDDSYLDEITKPAPDITTPGVSRPSRDPTVPSSLPDSALVDEFGLPKISVSPSKMKITT